MKILDQNQIQQKIKRLAFEIVERNYSEQNILLGGINNNGTGFAKLLKQQLELISDIRFDLFRIRLNPANPLSGEIEIVENHEDLNGKAIIVIDDVANTGRTIFYAIRPLLEVLPKKVEVAVLVDRTHKAFPIKVDFVGLSLATTTKENIDVKIRETSEMEVHLN